MTWTSILPQLEWGPLRVGFVLWAVLIAFFDWRQHRIPNALLLLALVPAVLTLVIDPIGLLGAGRLESALGLLVGFALFIPGYVSGVSGAGDVKLCAVCGLLLGRQPMVEAALIIGFGLLVFALMLIQRYGWSQAKQMRFPAGVAISAGFSAALLFPDAIA